MIILDSNNFAEALNLCYMRFNYRIGIAFSDSGRLRSFARALNHQLYNEGIWGIPHAVTFNNDTDSLVFDSGSYIKLFVAQRDVAHLEECFDSIYVDPDIKDMELLDNISRCQWTPFDTETEIEIDPQPLDEFLHGFERSVTDQEQ